ncbi:MAG: carboxymuconolactone decarboxylase family protein [bacterium]
MENQKAWYLKESNKIGSAFQHFQNTLDEQSVLDVRTRELLKLALACVLRCRHCTEGHIKKALELGATKQEITETLMIAALEGAGTQLAWDKEFFQEVLG